MVAGCPQSLRSCILRVGAVLAFHGGNQVVDQLVVEPVGKLHGKAVIAAVLRTGIVVSRHNKDHRLHFTVLYGVVDDIFEAAGVIRGTHQGRFIAPPAVTQIKDVVGFCIVIAVRQVDPRLFRQPLRVFSVGERFPCIIGKLFEFSLLLGRGAVAVRDGLQFCGDRAAFRSLCRGVLSLFNRDSAAVILKNFHRGCDFSDGCNRHDGFQQIVIVENRHRGAVIPVGQPSQFITAGMCCGIWQRVVQVKGFGKVFCRVPQRDGQRQALCQCAGSLIIKQDTVQHSVSRCNRDIFKNRFLLRCGHRMAGFTAACGCPAANQK